MANSLDKIMVSFPDRSLEDWKSEAIPFLQKYFDEFSTHAMTDHTMYLQGKKVMLGEVIEFIKNN